MNRESYFFRNLITLLDFSRRVGYFFNSFIPYRRPTKNRLCSVINVPRKAANITKCRAIKPR